VLGPENPRFGYVYGVALDSGGQRERAIEVWEETVARHPNDREVLNVLAMTLYQSGEHKRALVHAEHLAALSPGDPVPRQVVAAIRQELAREK
jgi:Flp pilus assembly protein TadD